MGLGGKRLNRVEDYEVFQPFVTHLIHSLIDEQIDNTDGPKILEYILIELSVKLDYRKIVKQLYDYLLNVINTTKTLEKMKVCMISRLALNLCKLSSA